MTEERLNAPSLKKLLADARREGATAEREKMQAEHRRDNRWFFEDGRRVGAEEMRERAAAALDEDAPWAARAIRALPLTSEEPT